jgi:protease-4
MVDAIYGAFVGRVAKGRGMTVERVRDLATGEIWLGERALELGLVDEIGDLERAVEVAAAFAGVPAKSAPVRVPRSLVGRLIERFTSRLASGVADEIETRLANRFRA